LVALVTVFAGDGALVVRPAAAGGRVAGAPDFAVEGFAGGGTDAGSFRQPAAPASTATAIIK
jgi:hypothetical protein